MFEAQAVQSAEETKLGVDEEVKSLERTLKNIDEARPFSDLTVVSIWDYQRLGIILMLILFALQDDVVAARPDIDVRVEQMVSRGRWMPTGYKVCTFFLLVFVPSRMFWAG